MVNRANVLSIDPLGFDALLVVTDQGKRSKAGRLKLVHQNGKLMTVHETDAPHESDLLQEVFLSGEITRRYSWQEVCDRADSAVNPV